MRQQLGSSVEYFERDLTAKILPAGRKILAAASTNITESRNVTQASNATAHQSTPEPASSTSSSSESSPAAAGIKEQEASIQPVPSTCLPILGLSVGLQRVPAHMLGAVTQSAARHLTAMHAVFNTQPVIPVCGTVSFSLRVASHRMVPWARQSHNTVLPASILPSHASVQWYQQWCQHACHVVTTVICALQMRHLRSLVPASSLAGSRSACAAGAWIALTKSTFLWMVSTALATWQAGTHMVRTLVAPRI
jgi:hypothetical protein